MADLITPLIFVSSPGDVSEERALAEGVLRRLGEEYRGSVHLKVVLWEHEPVFAHAGYQQQIARPSECDLVICILWSRLGTRLPAGFSIGLDGSAPTGTEFEVRDALEAYRLAGKPNLLIYRKTVAPQLNMASSEARERLRQYELLDDFCRRTFYDQQGAVIVAHTSYGESYEFEKKLVEHVRRWLALKVGDSATHARWTSGSPYRGLQAFEAEHREIYFGRSQALSELIGRLRETEMRTAAGERLTRFVLVQGMSGNGKSSLIRAGLLPLLQGRALEGIGVWRQAILKPSDRSEQRPDAGIVGALVAALGKTIPAIAHSYPDTAQLTERVRSAPHESAARLDGYLTQEAIGIGLRPEQIRLVVFIDQLEELFEQSLEQTERLAFIEILDALAREGRVWIIATVRSDFAARIEEHPALINLTTEGHLYILGPPQSDELAEMIREPAQAAGLQWEARAGVSLDQAILREATANPESLPLLEYALDQLYERRNGRHLTYTAYEALGGLQGGIAQSAEAVLSAQQDLASAFPLLMRSLVSVDENGTATRRYAPLTEFSAATPERALLEALVARRLCVTDQRGEEAVASFAHEALIHSWPRVSDWLQVEAGLLQTRELALRDARLWQQHDESEAWLATADKLIAFKALESAHVVLPPEGWRFIEQSRRRAQRMTRIKQLAGSLIAVLAIVASGTGWIASRKQHEAEHQTAQTLKAQSRLLTEVASERLKEGDFSYARGVILEVLSNARSGIQPDAAAVNVFQEIRAGDPQIAVLSGHTAAIGNAAYSPDGECITTASQDGTARIWDAHTGTQLAILLRSDDVVGSAAYSPDGTRIVTASTDVRIWDAHTGKLNLVLDEHESGVPSARFSPDGTRIVTASTDVRIWDAQSGKRLLVLVGEGGGAWSAAYSPDGNYIVAALADRTARVWNSRTGAQLAVLSGHSDTVSSAAFSPDGTRIVTACLDGTARIWDARSGALITALAGHVGQAWSAVYSPDGTAIVTAGTDKTARIWDAVTGALLGVLSGHVGIVESATYSADGTRVLTTSHDMTARIWEAHVGPKAMILSGHLDRLNDAEYSPDATQIVTASDDKTARIWDARSGAQRVVLTGHDGAVGSAAYSPDGKRIVTASDDSIPRIWDARTGAQLGVLSGHKGAVETAAYSPDGMHIVTAYSDAFGIWDAATGSEIGGRAGHDAAVHSAVYSPDGRQILTASLDRTARIWDSKTYTQLMVLPHGDFVNTAEYSRDGTRIVTSSEDKYARVWNARTGENIAILSGHPLRVFCAAFSPDGKHVVTSSKDNTVRIWDAETGTQLAVLLGHSARVVSVAYSPDGTHIVSASGDKTARIWDASLPADLTSQIVWEQSAVTDPLPDTERVRLGLRSATYAAGSSAIASKCDLEGSAIYDPDRRAPGVEQATINADIAMSACTKELSQPGKNPHLTYQRGRILLAKGDIPGARQDFELSASQGYRAARVDLATLLTDPSAHIVDTNRAVSLYQQAWHDGLPIAAFKLGQIYESGIPASDAVGSGAFKTDPAQAWLWYQRAAAKREPHALARFAERDEASATAEELPAKRNELLLEAFKGYAAAAERAYAESWPDGAWRQWRYRRASLARVLAHEGLMQQVADAYNSVRDKAVAQE